MKSKLYLPYTDYKINDERGEQILLETLIANGPAYKIVVHENDEWLRIQDEEILIGDWIEIIPKKESERIKEESEKFFQPAIDGMLLDDPQYPHPIPADNAIRGLKKALSYIVIANKHKAWIYGDGILQEAKNDIQWFFKFQNDTPEEGFERLSAFNDFITKYRLNKIQHLSMADNPNISHDFYDLLDDSLVKDLSEKGFSFGVLGHKYNKLERDIKNAVTDILNNKNLPYLLAGTGILASCPGDLKYGVLANSIGIITHRLRNVDLKEYAPPIRKEELFIFPRYAKSFNIKSFNNEVKVFLKKR